MVQAIPVVYLQWAAAIAAVAGAGATAYSSYKTGEAQATMYAAEARAAETEQRQAALKASQISAVRMQELNSNLSSIMAARAGKNLSGDSPTEQALIKSFTKESLTSKSNEVLDARLRRLGALNAKYSALGSSKAASTAGMLGAIEGTTEAVSRFSTLVRRSPRTTGTATTATRLGTGPA